MPRRQARALYLVKPAVNIPVPQRVLSLDAANARGRWDLIGRGTETSTGEQFYVWINKTGALCCLPVARFWA